MTIRCGDDPTNPDPEVGAIRVDLAISGTDPDQGCAVSYDGSEWTHLSHGSSTTYSNLAPGSHSVRLSDVALNCTVANNPRQITVRAGETTETTFEVSCAARKPGQDLIGRGYDVFGQYADPASTRSKVLDVVALHDAGLLEEVPNDHSTFATVSGRTVSEYSHSFSNRTSVEGEYMFFKASVDVSFAQSSLTRQEYEFATVQSLVRKYDLKVAQHLTAEQLRAYLTPEAAAAINDNSEAPADLFERFGTHALRGMTVGGRADYSVTANMLFEHQDRSIGVYAEASMDAKYSVGVSNETIDQQSMDQFNMSKQENLEVYGGRSELGQNIQNNGDYTAWFDSVDEEPSFCDFTEDGLVPLWELADDPARREELEQYFSTILAPQYDIQLGDLVSEFDTDAEGWSSTYDGVFYYLEAGHAACDAGGCVHARDGGGGAYYYFLAPDGYLGNWTRFEGGTLRYWIKNTHGYDTRYVRNDVLLSGTTGNLGYFYDPANAPVANTWRRYDISLEAGPQESGIWKIMRDGGWLEATEEEIAGVLSKVLVVQIRGEFYGSTDHAFLNRVAVCRPDQPECNN